MKILIFSNDSNDVVAFDEVLKARYPHSELKSSPTFEEGLKLLSFDGPFFCFVIDARQFKDQLTNVVDKIYDLSGKKPCIFIGERANIKKYVTDDIFDLNEENCAIERPLDRKVIQEAIVSCFEWAEKESFSDSVENLDPKNLIPMKVKHFYFYQSIPYNAYIEMLKGQYTKVINKDENYTHAYVNSFAKKNIKKFYLLKTDAMKLQEEALKKFNQALRTIEMFEQGQIFAMQIKSVEIIHQYIRSIGVTELVIEACNALIESVHKNYLNYHSFRKIMDVFPLSEADIATHAVLSMYLAEIMFIYQGWTGDGTRLKLELAAILQNCTLENDDLIKINGLKDKKLTKLTSAELTAFKEHPINAAKVANNFTSIPEVDFIIMQHHEHPSGNGFPNNVSFLHISTISATFIVTTQFISKYFIERATPDNLMKIFSFMEKSYNIGSFKEPVKTLRVVLNK